MAKKPLTYIHWPLSGQVPANLPPQTHIRRVEGGLGFAFAEGGSALRKGIGIVFGLAIAFTATTFISTFFNLTAGAAF